MPYPATADALERAWLDAIGPRTRLAIVDHISAESALVFPVAAIAAGLRSRGVAVLVDGAHAPGAIPLDIPALGADYYVANLHKWMWTPRSSGILWAAPDRQAGLHPTVISWGLDQGFTAEFDLVGTRDPSAHLSAPAAIALFHEWGLDDIRRYNHRLACDGARHLAARWATEFSTPDALIGTMATVALPTAAGTVPEDAVHLRTRLLEEDGIEVQMHAYRDRVRARISAQIYNDMDDIERFAAAVLRLVA
jgi:isopenicillin-N epimerase